MLPIETTKEGNKITKVCVEDIYKILNRVIDTLDKTYNNSMEIMDNTYQIHNDCEGNFIIGTGISEPCGEDEFDEELGNEIAFRKAKLNANLKKVRLLRRIQKNLFESLDTVDEELERLCKFIEMDESFLRLYNPDFYAKY